MSGKAGLPDTCFHTLVVSGKISNGLTDTRLHTLVGVREVRDGNIVAIRVQPAKWTASLKVVLKKEGVVPKCDEQS